MTARVICVILLSVFFLWRASRAPEGEIRYGRTDAWPPPASFFSAGAIGLSYFASKWFRYYLVDWIHWRMGELEAKEGVLELHDSAYDLKQRSDAAYESCDRGLPHAQGNFRYTGASAKRRLNKA